MPVQKELTGGKMNCGVNICLVTSMQRGNNDPSSSVIVVLLLFSSKGEQVEPRHFSHISRCSSSSPGAVFGRPQMQGSSKCCHYAGTASLGEFWVKMWDGEHCRKWKRPTTPLSHYVQTKKSDFADRFWHRQDNGRHKSDSIFLSQMSQAHCRMFFSYSPRGDVF